MARRGVGTEIYVEEMTKVEQEILLIQHELSDAQKLNDELTKKIERKDHDLLAKDEKLRVLKEKNAAELEQLTLESRAEKEKSAHEVAVREGEVRLLTVARQRLHDLCEENDHLVEAIACLEEEIRKDSEKHALAMHEMNKSMLSLRHQMEIKLRRELTGLDISFQKEAFSALHERQKKAMFENAKLKDEVALQGVGIANLSARLAKQKILYDKCHHHLQYLNNKSRDLRETLAGIAIEKNALIKQKEQYEEEMEDMRKRKEEIVEMLLEQQFEQQESEQQGRKRSLQQERSLFSHRILPDDSLATSQRISALYETTTGRIEEIRSSLIDSTCNFHGVSERQRRSHQDLLSQSISASTERLMEQASRYCELLDNLHRAQAVHRLWRRRFRFLQDALLELRPTNEEEGKGRFDPGLFALYDMVKSLHDRINDARQDEAVMANREGGEDESAGTGRDWDDISLDSNKSELMNNLDHKVPVLHWNDLVGQDEDLQHLLDGMRGTESNLTSTMHSIAAKEFVNKFFLARRGNLPRRAPSAGGRGEEEKDQNMLVWALLKIFVAWHCPPDLSKPEEELDEAEFQSGHMSLNEQAEEWAHQHGDEAIWNSDVLSLSGEMDKEVELQGTGENQLKQLQLTAPVHAATKYKVSENDRVLEKMKNNSDSRRHLQDEIGPPLVIRATNRHFLPSLSLEAIPQKAIGKSYSEAHLQLGFPLSAKAAASPGKLSAVASDPLFRKGKTLRKSSSNMTMKPLTAPNMLRSLQIRNNKLK